MAPASYRRLSETARISRGWIKLASRCIAWAMAAVMVAIAIDVYLVAVMIAGNAPLAVLLGGAATCLFAWLRFALPFMHRARKR